MKVILFRSVDNLGSAGEVVEVKRGYFRNYLEPRGYAREHTKANLALVESRRKKIEAIVARERSSAQTAAEALNGLVLTFELRANDRGQLFGSVTPMDIAKSLAEQGHQVDRRKIEVGEPIRTLGDFPIRIRLYPEVYAELTIKVERFLRPEEREAMEEEAERARKRAETAAEAEAEAPAEEVSEEIEAEKASE